MGGGSLLGERYVTVGGGCGLALRSVMTGWGGVKFTAKKRYVTLEWPLYAGGCSTGQVFRKNLDL